MKPDTLFPPPPHYGQPPLRCDDIPPPRQRAIQRLSLIGDEAENCVGMDLSGELPFPGTAKGFVSHVLRDHPFAPQIGALLVAAKIKADAADELPGVMLIHARTYWGRVSPMRGDIVIHADGIFPGHVSIVTRPLCMGCQHYEAVTLAGGPPQIAKVTQWHSAVKWIVRAVDESEAAVPGIEQEAAKEAKAPEAGSSADAPPPDAKPAAERKKTRTGVH